jgi:hypothetical protein
LLKSSSRRVAFAIAFCATSVSAQLTSDVVPRQRLVPREEQIRHELEDSSLRLGPFRLHPTFLLRDLGYNNNVYGTPENPVSDWSATVGAGTKWILPFGPKMYVRGNAVADYTWYAELADRRILGGTYDVTVTGLFNRLSVEAGAGTQKTFTVLSSEIDSNVVRKLDHVLFDAEIDLLQRLSLFASARAESHAYEAPGVIGGDLSRLDDLAREEELVRGGVRYRFRSFLDVSVAAERTESTFDRALTGRDNTSEAIVLGLHYDRPRAYLNLNVASREGRGMVGSLFPDYDATTGSYFASYSLVAPIEVQAYGHRKPVFSVFENSAFFLEDRNGAALLFRLGDRVVMRVFGEAGQNEYPKPASGGITLLRFDDALTYGGGFAVRLFRSAAFTVLVTQSEFDSNLDNFDRSVIRVQSGISFGGFPR